MDIIALLLLLLLDVAVADVLQCNVSSTQDALPRWTMATGLTFSRDSHAAAVFRNQIYVVGGVSTSYYTKRLESTTTRSDVVTTTDGMVWTEILEEAPFRRRFGHTLTAFTDASDNRERLILLGGFSPEPATDVWTTLDGGNWTQVTNVQTPWAGRGYHCTVVFQNQLWIMGGSPMTNDVWSTTSVLNGPWIQQLNVPWTPRAAHACAAHKVVTNITLGDASVQEFVFLVGGWEDTTLQDVWRMDATGTWTQLIAMAPWPKRAWHSLVSFDSRTNGDVEFGPRLWLIGGGIVGNGVQKMHPYWDAWYTRNGSDWIEASSDASGISTADWSMITTREKQTCTGKWGHSVVAFQRPVERSYYCNATCKNEGGTVSYAHQIIPVCNPSKTLPSPPTQKTVLIKSTNSVTTRTLYPDGCGVCYGSTTDRYVNATTVPALVLIAGNVGTQKVKDVFYSDDAMLCEQNGVICSNKGTCTLGGTCLCISGKTGQFCESDTSYTVVDGNNCFPPSALVTTKDHGPRPMSEIQPGDQVLTMDLHTGQAVFSVVYYIPHDTLDSQTATYIRIRHAPILNPATTTSSRTLELTPKHLLYVVAPEFRARVLKNGSLPLISDHLIKNYLVQRSGHEIQRDDLLVMMSPSTETGDGSGSITLSRVHTLTWVPRHGAMTLYTATATLFVDGVLCSNFADLYPSSLAELWQPQTATADSKRQRRRRDIVVMALFTPHRLLFTVLPFPLTARLLRRLMDIAVLPWLPRLWSPRYASYNQNDRSPQPADDRAVNRPYTRIG